MWARVCVPASRRIESSLSLTTFASAFPLGVIFISRRAIEPQPSNINLAGYLYTFVRHDWRPQSPVALQGKLGASIRFPVMRTDKSPDMLCRKVSLAHSQPAPGVDGCPSVNMHLASTGQVGLHKGKPGVQKPPPIYHIGKTLILVVSVNAVRPFNKV